MIAGVDPDTKNIVVAKGARILTASAKERTAENRFRPLMKQWREAVLPHLLDVDWVYIELPPMGVNPRATINQALVVGAIIYSLDVHKVGWSLVDPGTWKRLIIGNGRADKPLIKEWAVANLGLADNLAQDFYDAAVIQRYGEVVSGSHISS